MTPYERSHVTQPAVSLHLRTEFSFSLGSCSLDSDDSLIYKFRDDE